MERFIVGRQLLVVVVVFVLNLTCTFDKGVCSASFEVSDTLQKIFCDTGVASIFTTLLLGQLTSQIVSATNMLVILNNFIMPITTVISLLIEYSGLLHSVYLVQIVFNKLTGKTPEKQKEKSALETLFFWARVFMSLTFLAFAFAIHLSEIAKGRTLMYKGVPAGVSIAIFFLLMIIVGHLEGMQIAIFAVMRMDPSVQRTKVAQLCCDIAFKGENLRKIVVGRQMLATVCMFIIARITSVDNKNPDFEIGGETSLNVGVHEPSGGFDYHNRCLSVFPSCCVAISDGFPVQSVLGGDSSRVHVPGIHRDYAICVVVGAIDQEGDAFAAG
eukprot:c14264_g1_i2.p1 GENE.c14264_g1_i2~~c14264_g1_i2.p1  ORF type:complete len:383 (+),score=103.95 c14264_g1_i2:165-1151(+)